MIHHVSPAERRHAYFAAGFFPAESEKRGRGGQQGLRQTQFLFASSDNCRCWKWTNGNRWCKKPLSDDPLITQVMADASTFLTRLGALELSAHNVRSLATTDPSNRARSACAVAIQGAVATFLSNRVQALANKLAVKANPTLRTPLDHDGSWTLEKGGLIARTTYEAERFPYLFFVRYILLE